MAAWAIEHKISSAYVHGVGSMACKVNFHQPKTNFKMFNAFADKDKKPELPGSDWDYTFSEQNGKTIVRITIYNESPDNMEKMIEMGFKEGFTTSMTNPENLLATVSKKMIGLQNIHKFYFKESE